MKGRECYINQPKERNAIGEEGKRQTVRDEGGEEREGERECNIN